MAPSLSEAGRELAGGAAPGVQSSPPLLQATEGEQNLRTLSACLCKAGFTELGIGDESPMIPGPLL